MRMRTIVVLVVLIAAAIALIYAVMLIRHGFSARDNPSRLEAMVAARMRRWAIPVAAREQKNPVSNSPEVFNEAMEHFADHCAICHANNGSGETEIGQKLYPKAPDMRKAPTQDLSDGEIYYIIHNGIRLTGMPAWGDRDNDLDSWKLVHFIRHLPRLTATEEKAMESLNPRSRAEFEEELEEQRFLDENEAAPRPRSKKPHH